MASLRAKALVGAVALLALAQVFVEDVLVFAGLTGRGSTVPPLVFVAVPGAIALLLVALLLGSALLASDWQGR